MQLAHQFPSAASAWYWSTAVGWDERSAGCCGWPACRARNSSCPLLVNRRVLGVGRGVGRVLDRVGLRLRTDVGEVLRGHASLSDGEARAAFLHTLRTIIDPLGQRVDARDRLYLAQGLPFLIIWGERDPIIPLAHGQAAHDLVPGSRLEIFPSTGHFPHLEDPQRFVRLLLDFMGSTEAASSNPAASVSSCARAERRPRLVPAPFRRTREPGPRAARPAPPSAWRSPTRCRTRPPP
jgi:pimeloyl-ACP methyl ester carboxylesterase